MNFFSGARRISLVVGALALAVMVYRLATEEPRVVLRYQVPDFNAAPELSTDCRIGIDAFESVEYRTPAGRPFSIELCFVAAEAENGKLLIPYRMEDGQVYLGGRYDADVQVYTEAYAAQVFKQPTTKQYEVVENEYESQWAFEKGRIVGQFAAGLGLFWLFVWVIGWIVRGFLGIPRGADHRVAHEHKSTPSETVSL